MDVEEEAATAAGANFKQLMPTPGQLEQVANDTQAVMAPPTSSSGGVAGAGGVAAAGAGSASAGSKLVVPSAKVAHPVVVVGR